MPQNSHKHTHTQTFTLIHCDEDIPTQQDMVTELYVITLRDAHSRSYFYSYYYSHSRT